MKKEGSFRSADVCFVSGKSITRNLGYVSRVWARFRRKTIREIGAICSLHPFMAPL